MDKKEEHQEKLPDFIKEAFVSQYHARERIKELARQGKLFKK